MDVQLVAVPVFVTTKDGQAVAALTAADFEIEDQGRAVPVAGFLAVDAADPAATLPGASRALSAAARRQFLLLFDLTFSNTTGLLKAREAALDFLQDGPQPGDLVAVASFGPGGVNVLLSFSPDRRQAAQAVATLGSAESLRLRDPLGIAYDLGVPLSEGSGKWGLMLKHDEEQQTRPDHAVPRSDPPDGARGARPVPPARGVLRLRHGAAGAAPRLRPGPQAGRPALRRLRPDGADGSAGGRAGRELACRRRGPSLGSAGRPPLRRFGGAQRPRGPVHGADAVGHGDAHGGRRRPRRGHHRGARRDGHHREEQRTRDAGADRRAVGRPVPPRHERPRRRAPRRAGRVALLLRRRVPARPTRRRKRRATCGSCASR